VLTSKNPVTTAAPVDHDCIAFSARPAATTTPDCTHRPWTASTSTKPPHPLLPRAIVKTQTPLLPSEFALVSIATELRRVISRHHRHAYARSSPPSRSRSSNLSLPRCRRASVVPPSRLHRRPLRRERNCGHCDTSIPATTSNWRRDLPQTGTPSI